MGKESRKIHREKNTTETLMYENLSTYIVFKVLHILKMDNKAAKICSKHSSLACRDYKDN